MTTTTTTAATGTTRARVREFRLPDLGEGLTESEIVQWHIREGDTVALNQIIADVETAKAVVELPSPYAGVVVRLHEPAGTVVDVGAPIVSFEVQGESDDVAPASEAGSGAGISAGIGTADAPARREPNLVGYGAAVEKGGRPQRRSRLLVPSGSASASPAAGTSAVVPPELTERTELAERTERPRSTPPVRKLARDLGICLDDLTGTGERSLITRGDVLAAIAGAATVGAVPPQVLADALVDTEPDAEPGASVEMHQASPPPGLHGAFPGRVPTTTDVRMPIRGMRKHTAAAMVASAFTAPHVTEFLTIDVTQTMDLLAELKASRAFDGTRITPLTIVAKALCLAVTRNPTLNSSWDEEAQEIVQYADVNLGIAAATPRGLLVPNIKAAQTMNLAELAGALGSLTETARGGKTPPSDLSGGTISITNIGVFGIDAGTPILNPGEAAILAMGAVRSAPWEYRGAVALRSVMTLSLSFDHRLVDGEQGSRFLADVGLILRHPAMVLTMV